VRHGEAASRIEGADLTRFMGTLNEYLGFVEKVDKRIRNEKLTELLARAELCTAPISHRKPRATFRPSWRAARGTDRLAEGVQFKVSAGGGRGAPHLVVCFTDAQGARAASTGRWLRAPSSGR
jgi:DNA gyrase subunit B